MIGFVSERFSDVAEDCWKDLKRGCSDENTETETPVGTGGGNNMSEIRKGHN